jgi:hypothetical protein
VELERQMGFHAMNYSVFLLFGNIMILSYMNYIFGLSHVIWYNIPDPSNYTEEGYKHLVKLFIDSYDNSWETPYILKKNREMVKSVGKITNSIPNKERKRELRLWSMTIEDIYLGGEQNAISNINKWKERVRNDLRHWNVWKMRRRFMTVEKIIYKINEELKEVPGIVGMVLGGSRARGIHHPASDIYTGMYYNESVGFEMRLEDCY